MDRWLKNIIGNKKISYICLAFSYLVGILYSYVLSFTERGLPLFDPFNIGLYLFWLVILLWIAWDINKDKYYVKGTLLFLSILILVLTKLDVFEDESSVQLVSLSVVEASLLFIAYVSIKIPSSELVSSFEIGQESLKPKNSRIILPLISSVGFGIVIGGFSILTVTIILGSSEFLLCLVLMLILLFMIICFFLLRKISIRVNMIIGVINWSLIALFIMLIYKA